MRLRNLLLVEDDTVDQRRIQRFLRSKDGAGPVAVRVVATGAEGLRELEEQSFDCLLLDHELPDVDGLSIVRLLRGSQEPAQRQLPIVLIAGITDEGLLDRAYDSGVSDYV